MPYRKILVMELLAVTSQIKTLGHIAIYSNVGSCMHHFCGHSIMCVEYVCIHVCLESRDKTLTDQYIGKAIALDKWIYVA